METVRAYYRLTKPGIVYGNVLSAAAGFLLITRIHIDYLLLIEMVISIALVIASACVLNNYLDRELDAKMARTSRRALVVGSIPLHQALIYATVLGVVGLLGLIIFTNWLTTVVGIIGYIDYIVIYGLAKRRSTYGTALGSISGAAGLVAGYVTATKRLDLTVLILFLIMVFWQMAHFHAIALYRLKDYQTAGLPVLPVRKGHQHTKTSIQLYIVGFIIMSVLLAINGKVGLVYLVVMFVIGSMWFWLGLSQADSHTDWARRMFRFSLIVLLVFCLLLDLNVVLP